MLVLASTGAEWLEAAGFIIINSEKKHLDILTSKLKSKQQNILFFMLFYHDFITIVMHAAVLCFVVYCICYLSVF